MSMKYIGAGSHVPNIPARDLSDAEVQEYGAEALLATGLYVAQPEETKQPAPKSAKVIKEGDS